MDALLNPIYHESKFQLADEGIHGGFVKKTYGRLARVERRISERVWAEFSSQQGIYPEQRLRLCDALFVCMRYN